MHLISVSSQNHQLIDENREDHFKKNNYHREGDIEKSICQEGAVVGLTLGIFGKVYEAEFDAEGLEHLLVIAIDDVLLCQMPKLVLVKRGLCSRHDSKYYDGHEQEYRQKEGNDAASDELFPI